jgi:hypothetical protein
MRVKIEIRVDPASLRRLAEDLGLYRNAPYSDEDHDDEDDGGCYRHHIDDLRELAYEVLECWRNRRRR